MLRENFHCEAPIRRSAEAERVPGRVAIKTAAASVALSGLLALTACQSPNEIAMKIGAPPDSAVKLRAVETRRYETLDEPALLAAAAQTLQDLGFTISESSSEVGVLVASKQRDAEEAGQVAAQVALTLVALLFLVPYEPVWDKDQNIAVSVVTTPIENSRQIEVRASFDRQIRDTKGQVRAELIDDPEIYKQFFDKLSSAVFLEGHPL